MPKAILPNPLAALAEGKREETVLLRRGDHWAAVLVLIGKDVRCDVVTYEAPIYTIYRLGRLVAHYNERTGALLIHWPEIAKVATESVRDTAFKRIKERADGDRLPQDPYGSTDPFRRQPRGRATA